MSDAPGAAPGSEAHKAIDLYLNIAVYGAIAVCGIAFLGLLSYFQPAETIGIVNQVLAIYLIVGQISALGIHLAVQNFLAVQPAASRDASACALGALIASSAVAAFVCALLFLFADDVGQLLGSAPVGAGVRIAVPAIFLLAFNKALLAITVGLQRLRSYAALQLARPVGLIGGLGVLTARGAEGAELVWSLVLGEIGVTVLGLILLLPFLIRAEFARVGAWVSQTLWFGVRAALSNVLLEINARIDVLVLGVFASDRIVGIYSFAATLIEGMSQLPVVARTALHRQMTGLAQRRDTAALEELVAVWRLRAYLAMAAVAFIAIGLFPVVVRVLAPDIDPNLSWMIFAIVAVGVVASSGYVPASNIVLQAGFPAVHTAGVAILAVFNLALCAVLTSMYGALGAAVAAGATYAALALLVRYGARRFVGARI